MFLLLCPGHADIIARDGWTKNDLKNVVAQTAGFPFREWRRGGMFGMFESPGWLGSLPDDAFIPLLQSPDKLHIAVVGGQGRDSSSISGFGIGRSVSRCVKVVSS